MIKTGLNNCGRLYFECKSHFFKKLPTPRSNKKQGGQGHPLTSPDEGQFPDTIILVLLTLRGENLVLTSVCYLIDNQTEASVG